MKFMKQVISLCLVLALLCGFLPLGARAEEAVTEETVAEEAVAEDLLPVSQEQVVEGYSEEPVRLLNPLYADLVTEEAFVPASGARVQMRATPVVVTSAKEAADVLRENMKNRQEETSVCLNIPTADEDDMLDLAVEIFNMAMMHTGVPTEGDYLAWIWYDGQYSLSYEGVQGDIDLTLNYTFKYTTSAAQEAVMDERVASVLAELDLEGKSDYGKIKGIYYYICTHVTWDANNYDDMQTQSAYAALVNGASAHLGFAPLLYRLALELGVDCRVISGKIEHQGASLTHLWNILKLDGKYYNADTFADSYFFEDNMAAYQFFLSSPETTFLGHTRDAQYDSAEFYAVYPNATTTYVHEHSYNAVVTKPTCTEDGYTTYTCDCGDSKKDNVVAMLGHSWDAGVVTKEPTVSVPGVKTYTCSVCKTTRTEEIYVAVSCDVERISGKDRVKTALSVAKALKDTLKVDKFNAVIIATGVNEKFADALAGSYLANVKGAPILLYTGSSLSQLNVDFIHDNLKAGGTVYILGGTGAVPESVEETLSGYNVKRLSGKNRYETNLAILNEADTSDAKEILIATGTNFADSLSASAVGLPLLLVDGNGTGLNATQINFLKTVSGKKITVIGGTGAVNEDVMEAIEAAAGVRVERISGKTRYNTSVMIAEKYFDAPEYALLTYAWNFPDGLAGGPLANAVGAPLLLTDAGQEAVANEYITEEHIEKGFVLGGTGVVSDATTQKAFGLSAGAVIEKTYYTE